MIQSESARNSSFAPEVWKRFSLAFLSLALFFCLIIAVIYRQDVVHQRALLEQESEHVLNMQQELLLFEFRAVQSDLLYLASQDKLTQLLSGDRNVEGDLSSEHVNFAQNKQVYDQIRCLDIAGQEIARINYRDGRATVVPSQKLQSKAARYYFQQALSLTKGEVFVSPFDLNVEHGAIEEPLKPVIRFLAPVFDDAGRKQGFLVLNYLGAHLLAKLKRIATGFRGQTMLVNSAGEYLQAPNPDHEWGWLLGHQNSFRGRFPLAWKRGGKLDSGQFHIENHLFSFQRLSPGKRSTVARSLPQKGALILAAYVSSSVANAHSRALLSQLMLMVFGVLAVVALLSFYWARAGVIRHGHERRIAESEARLRQLSSMLLAAQETERRNLSRDLHDELGQLVTAIGLDLRSLAKKTPADSDPLLQRAIDETDHLLNSLHEIAARVRPSVLDDLGLTEAIESGLSDYQQRTGITVTAHLSLGQGDVSAIVGENVYRILQEGLSNVATHAQVKEVAVTIETDREMLRMEIEDKGIGFDPSDQAKSGRLGILGLRERVELLNGQFELHSAPGKGTRISVSIPIHANEP